MDSGQWLNTVAVISLVAAFVSTVVIAIDLLSGNSQHMPVMNVVWPLTALYFGPLALWAYYKWGKLNAHHRMMEAKKKGLQNPANQKPFWQTCAAAATHCGGGCTLGDIAVELSLLFCPISLFGHKIFAAWAADYGAAFLFGIIFQYFTIKPMKNLSLGQGIVQAIKADTLSISFWQIGMYGWMAVVTFLIFRHELDKNSPLFWFMMQIAMWFGFAASYPINAWLLKRGIKEKM